MGIAILLMAWNYSEFFKVFQGTQLNQQKMENHSAGNISNFQSLYYFAIIAYVCEKVLGKKIVGGKLYVIKDLGL